LDARRDGLLERHVRGPASPAPARATWGPTAHVRLVRLAPPLSRANGLLWLKLRRSATRTDGANIWTLFGPRFFLCKLVGTIFLYLAQRILPVVSVMTDYSHCTRAQRADGHVVLDVIFSTTVTEIKPYIISTLCLDVS